MCKKMFWTSRRRLEDVKINIRTANVKETELAFVVRGTELAFVARGMKLHTFSSG
jgi:hypothetical protein